MRITVGIVTRLLMSADGGRSWIESARTVPASAEPKRRGTPHASPLTVPLGWKLSHVHVGSDGAGLAAGSEPVSGPGQRTSIARFWRTRDGGATWQPTEPDIGRWGRLRAWPSWPPEAVDSIAVLSGGLLAFAWDDPWIYEGPHSHLVHSEDGGSHWRYTRLPDGCIDLAQGLGPLRVFGGARVVERSSSGALRREATDLAWILPPEYWQTPRPLRSVQFISEAEGYALVASWPREVPGKKAEDLPPPLIGFARTEDGGRRWKVVGSWEGPRSVDLNERHELALEVD